MADVFDTSKYILEKTGKISTWKLQKLVYYSQAWALAWTDKPIFEEDYEAWANGPVCPELFQLHKKKFLVGADDLGKGSSDNLSADEKETIDIVIRDYGEMEPYELRELTHSESPWIEARGGVPEGEPCSTVITKDSIGEYYGGL